MRSSTSARSSRALSVLLIAALALMLTPAVAIAPPPPPGTTWYVDVVNGDDATGDGTAGAPYETISQALEDGGPVDTIVVAPGTYTYSNEDMPFDIPPGMTIESSDGPDVTILDGEWNTRIMEVRGVEGNEVSIEGFTFTRGSDPRGGGLYVTDSTVSVFDCVFTDCIAEFGSAIAAAGSFLSIQKCRFEHNGYFPPKLPPPPTAGPAPELGASPWGDAIAEAGGAIDLEACVASLENCVIYDNIAVSSGGGINAYNSSLMVFASDVTSNAVADFPFGGASTVSPADLTAERVSKMGGTGGGIAVFGEIQQTMLNETTIAENSAYMAGGVFFENYGGEDLNMREAEQSVPIFEPSFLIMGCDIRDNVATGYGGGVATFPYMGESVKPPPPGGDTLLTQAFDPPEDFVLPSFEEDSAPPPFGPGAGIVEQTVFEGNMAPYGSALSSIWNDLYVENSLFFDNVNNGEEPDSTMIVLSQEGFEPTVADVVNCTFTENSGGYASIRAVFGTQLNVDNTIFWNNDYREMWPEEEPPPPWLEPSRDGITLLEERVRPFADTESCYVAFSDTPWGDIFYTPGPGNIAVDPQFANPANDNFRLSYGSPALDVASPIMAPPWDMDWTDRPQDGDLDGDDEFDMGCYELEATLEPGVDRVDGDNRYGTATEISAQRFDTADTVFICTGETFADGLTVSGLAGWYWSPILLTRPDSLPNVTRNEILRLGASEAIIVGGPNAVSENVRAQLEALGLEVSRIGGANRYETASLIADEILNLTGWETAPLMFVARGDQPWDALSVSPVAFWRSAPILLVKPDEMPASTVDVIQESDPLVVIMGGKEAVDSHVAKEAVLAGAQSLDRIAGANRFETAANISTFAVANGWAQWTVTGLTTGSDFADALTGGPALGTVNGVMLMTDPSSLSPAAEQALIDNKTAISRLEVYGGVVAIDPAVEAQARGIIQ